MRFIADTGFFKHPSAKKEKDDSISECRQGVVRRVLGPLNIQVSQWIFPDTATFQGNILTCTEQHINEEMEDYAFSVLALFYPYRSHEDLLPVIQTSIHPYVKKLREIYSQEVLSESRPKQVFSDRNLTFLQNLYRTRRTTVYDTRLERTIWRQLPSVFNPRRAIRVTTTKIMRTSRTTRKT
jgi:hypothetical protein